MAIKINFVEGNKPTKSKNQQHYVHECKLEICFDAELESQDAQDIEKMLNHILKYLSQTPKNKLEEYDIKFDFRGYKVKLPKVIDSENNRQIFTTNAKKQHEIMLSETLQ